MLVTTATRTALNNACDLPGLIAALQALQAEAEAQGVLVDADGAFEDDGWAFTVTTDGPAQQAD